MGIPGFASRVRHHGSISTLGGRGEIREDHAIIDGPSLAHSLLHQVSKNGAGDGAAILPQHSYAAIGKAAIDWLDTLKEHGFEIEAIYFDGALPEHKRETRIERLQAYVDKLVTFKAVHDEAIKALRNLKNQIQPETIDRRIGNARRSLPPPPFLVFAVIDALRQSKYANRTYTVDGEADEFCAAHALATEGAQTTIFTNDSDLVVYGLGERTRVVQINELSQDESEDGHALTGLEFWPKLLCASGEDQQMPDLIRPAYLMQCDQHLSYRNAVAESRIKTAVFGTEEFRVFAAAYDLSDARQKLTALQQSATTESEPYRYLDSRISELLLTVTGERDRIRRTQEWYANEDSRVLEQRKADVAGGWHAPHDVKGLERSDAKHASTKSGVTTRDFAYDPKEQDLKPADMDLFLPVLFEDPTRATAWRAGAEIREVAIHLANTLIGTVATVCEFKRSGQRISGTAVQQISDDFCNERLTQWIKLWKEEVKDMATVGRTRYWRLLVMRHLLADLTRGDKGLPVKDAVMSALKSRAASSWDQVHFQAQYEATYYSLRIMKQILRFLIDFDRDCVAGLQRIEEASKALDTLPDITDFFELGDERDGEGTKAFEAAIIRCLEEYGVSAQTEKKGNVPAKRGRDGRKKAREKPVQQRQPKDQKYNAFAFLDDGGEV